MAVIKFNFLSKYLGMQTNVSICLPTFSFADVVSSKEATYVRGMKYQTMYLLHGFSGDDSDFVNFTNIVRYSDDNKLAVVMPCGYNSDYADNPKGPRYLKYLTEELPLVCQSLFPLSDKRTDNFIAGLSMGGHGAMKIALMYPERFSAALIMSGAAKDAAFFAEMRNAFKKKDSDIMPSYDTEFIYGDAEKFETSEHNAYKYAKENIISKKELPEFFFTCGTDDFALELVETGYKRLNKLGYRTHLETVPGYGHEWDFWDLTLRKAINEWLPIRHKAIYP